MGIQEFKDPSFDVNGVTTIVSLNTIDPCCSAKILQNNQNRLSMKFLSLDLYNFRRYESAKFKFNPKFTVLTYFQNSGLKTGQGGIRKSDSRFVTREKGGQVFLERMKKVSLVGTGFTSYVKE